MFHAEIDDPQLFGSRSFRLGIVAGVRALSGGPEAAGLAGVYEGTIGNAHVIAALAEDSGRYFYAGKPDDLGLIVSPVGMALKIQETLAPTIAADDLKDHPQLLSGLWKVTFANDGLKGSWTDAQGKHARPVALRRIGTADESLYDFSATLTNSGAYGGRWLHDAPALAADPKEMTIGPLTDHLLRDTQFGGAVPRLLRGPANVNLAAVNASLARLQNYLRLDDRDCFQGLRAMRVLPPTASSPTWTSWTRAMTWPPS